MKSINILLASALLTAVVPLQAQIDTLTADNTRLQAESFELQRLRELYKLDSEYLQYETVAARVIAKDSGGWFRVFRINKGAYDGIKKDMNVIAGGGLVGIVTDVGTNYSTVRAIIDDLSRVSAMAMQTGDSCMVSGDIKLYQEGKIKLTDVKLGSELKDGDKIALTQENGKVIVSNASIDALREIQNSFYGDTIIR